MLINISTRLTKMRLEPNLLIFPAMSWPMVTYPDLSWFVITCPSCFDLSSPDLVWIELKCLSVCFYVFIWNSSYWAGYAAKKIKMLNIINKLGLNWAKLSSNWNWGLLWLRFATLHWWLPTTISYPYKLVNLVISTYLHTSLLTCMLACLLAFLYTGLQMRPNCPLLTVNSNRPKSHPSHPLNFH